MKVKMYIANGLKEKTNVPRYDNVPFALVAGMMFLPLSKYGNLLRLAVALILFLVIVFKKGIVSITKELFLIFSIMLMSLVLSRFSVLIIEGEGNPGAWTHEFQRIGFYIMLIYVVYNCKVSFEFLFKICIITLFIHTTIQTLQLMGVEAVFDFIEEYYLEDGNSGIHLSLARTSNIANFRSGSIYMNPNVYMVIPLSILGVILQRDRMKFSIYNLLFIAVALYSLLLTGSRTTLIIGVCMLVYYFVKREDLQGLRWLILGVGAVIFVATIGMMATKYRAFNVADGLSSSVGSKINMFMNHIYNSPKIYLLTGSLSSLQAPTMDSEFTHIYVYFGVCGIVWYMIFLSLILRNKDKYPLQSVLLLLNVCLIALTASVLLCMPVFAFVCLLSLAELE